VLNKRTERHVRRGALAGALQDQPDRGLDRRSFLRRSGLVAGSLAALGTLPLTTLRRAEAGPPPPAGAQLTSRKNVCTHCSVGCTVIKHGAIYRPSPPYGRGTIDPDTGKKGLQVEFTVEDPGVFTTPWSGRVTYRRLIGDWGTDAAAPTAHTPDF
jgi:hypothetical protein